MECHNCKKYSLGKTHCPFCGYYKDLERLRNLTPSKEITDNQVGEIVMICDGENWHVIADIMYN